MEINSDQDFPNEHIDKQMVNKLCFHPMCMFSNKKLNQFQKPFSEVVRYSTLLFEFMNLLRGQWIRCSEP